MRAAADPDDLAFEPPDSRAGRRFAGLDDRGLHPRVVGHGIEHAGRLRCLEREVEAGCSTWVWHWDGAVRREAAVARGEAGEDGSEVVGVDGVGEAELGRATADPDAGGLAGARVVVVERLGNARQLVRLLADTESRYRQHVGQLDSEYTPR